MSVIGPITTAVAVGAAGAAAGTVVSSQPVRGMIIGIDIQYNDAPPAGTTDVGIKTKGASGVLPSRNILTISNAATDGYFCPRVETVKADGSVSSFVDGVHYVEDYIQVDMAGANAGDSVSIWIYTDKS